MEDLLIKYYEDISELVDANLEMCEKINANTRKIQSYMYRIRDVKNKINGDKTVKHTLIKPKNKSNASRRKQKELMSEESFWEDILNM